MGCDGRHIFKLYCYWLESETLPLASSARTTGLLEYGTTELCVSSN